MTVRTEQDLRSALVDVHGVEAAEARLTDLVRSGRLAGSGARTGPHGGGARRLAPVAGGVAAAAAVVGATLAVAHGTGGSRPPAPAVPAASHAPSTPAPRPPAPDRPVWVTPQVVSQVLRSLLPAGTVTDLAGDASVLRTSTASFVWDDGHGAVLIQASVNYQSYRPGGHRTWPPCGPDPAGEGYYHCHMLGDGSAVTIYESPGHLAGKPQSSGIVLQRADGLVVEIDELNSRTYDVSTVTRPKPPLSRAELESLARSPRWTARVPAATAAAAGGLFTPQTAAGPGGPGAPSRTAVPGSR